MLSNLLNPERSPQPPSLHQPDYPRDASWWADVWANAKWVNAAKNSFIVGFFSTLLATVLGTLAALGLSRPEMPYRRASCLRLA